VTAPGGLTARDVAAHYDAAYYADLAARYRRRTRFARQRIRNVFALLPVLRGRSVLDLGCGVGTFAVEAARRGAWAVGLDPAAAALEAARAVAGAEGVEGARFVRAEAERIPFAAESFDVVIAADVTEHLDDATLSAALAEVARVLRVGGVLVLYTPAPSHLFERLRARGFLLAPDPSHIGLRPAGVLAERVRCAGLEVVQVRYLPSHVPGWRWLEWALGRWVGLLRRRIGIVARKGGGG